MRISNITIGADPELFIINEKTKKVVSSIGLIPGEKGNPYVAADMPSGFGLETDNILAEFNIPPVRDRISFINNIEYMKGYIDKFVKNINSDLGILCTASRVVDASQLKSPQAKMFGCDIDYNAYTDEPNEKPNGAATRTRSAGFHIHIGYTNNNIDTSVLLVKYLDMYLGIPSVIKDKDKKRRSLYGKAGAFRLQPWGVEYRVLSSAMMKNIDSLNFVWDQLAKAIQHCAKGDLLISPNIVCDIINNSNVELAKEVVSNYHLI